jgi:hypothetical protein
MRNETDTFPDSKVSKEDSLRDTKSSIQTTLRHFREFNNNAPTFSVEGQERLDSKESSVTYEYNTLIDEKTGQKYRIAILNKEELDKGTVPTILTLQFNTIVEHGSMNYFAQEISQGGRPVIIIESPSIGKSSDMTKEQFFTLRKGDNPFSEISESLLRSLNPILKVNNGTNKQIDVAGYSQGAITALSITEVANSLGISVRKAFLLEIPGVKDFAKEGGNFKKFKSSAKIMAAFISEGANLSWYQNDPHDKKQRIVSGVEVPENSVKIYGRFVKNLAIKPIFRKGILTAYPTAMARRVVPNILNAALEKQPDMKCIFLSGSDSNITLKEDIYDSIKPYLNTGRIRRIILPGDTHSVGERAKRVGSLFRRTMDDTITKLSK